MSSRAVLVGLVVLGAASIDPGRARSQGSAAPTEPPPAPATDDPGEDEDTDPAAGSAAGSGSAITVPAAAPARRAWLLERIDTAITARPTLARAKLAIAITDLATGDELHARAADEPLNLASNAKLLTATAALATLGAGFRWRTSVFAAAPDDAGLVTGDLYLRGTGDPLLSVDHLEELADELVARGVRRIDGQLVLDTSYFDDAVDPPHFDEQPEERAAFRAPVASLGVARSSVTIIVVADPGGGATVRFEPDAGDYHRFTRREVVSVTEGRTRLRIQTKPKRDHVEYEVTGQIRAGAGSWDFRRRVDDPARFCAEVFKRALAVRGISVRQRRIGNEPVPPTAKLIAFHDSAPLGDVIRGMNKYSDNYVAESVLKTIGAERRVTPGPATWGDGIAAVQTALAALGLPADAYRAGNGSGLFAATEVSARQLVNLLRAAHADYRIGPDLLASLPIGGTDGTLARRLRDRPAQGRVRAKTGTLDKVITLGGYVGVDSGHPIAFAILINDVPAGQRGMARAMIDDIVDALAMYLGAT